MGAGADDPLGSDGVTVTIGRGAARVARCADGTAAILARRAGTAGVGVTLFHPKERF